MRQAARARIGDYQITRSLPATMPALLEFEAMHVLLPRQARVRLAEATTTAKHIMREACILEALRHPGVPRVYECGMLDDRRPWIAIEMLDGPTLAGAIANGPLVPAQTLSLLGDLTEILAHAHARGIVHCRLRPENIARHSTGICITSWGGAVMHDSAPHLLAADKQIYLAPELAREAPFEARADIYSLGVIAYETLTLAPPTLPIGRRLPGLPRPIALLIERMMSGTALARPTAAEVRAEASRLLELVEAPEPDVDSGVVVEEIEIDLTDDVSRERELRWTPAESYQAPPPVAHAPSRRRSS